MENQDYLEKTIDVTDVQANHSSQCEENDCLSQATNQQESDCLSQDDDNKPKKRKGNPAFVKGNKLSPGRPKGSRDKTNELVEKMQKLKYDPLIDLVRIAMKTHDEKLKAQIGMKLVDKVYANKKEVEVNQTTTEDKTITVQFSYAPPDAKALEALQREFGVIDAQVIAPALVAHPDILQPDGFAIQPGEALPSFEAQATGSNDGLATTPPDNP